MVVRWIIGLLMLLPCDYLFAKEEFIISSPQIISYQPSYGSLGNIRSISQGNNGFIWLTTATGLYRYDGFEFKKIFLKGEPDTYDLVKDATGNFWISTLNKGLYRYDPIMGNAIVFQKNTNNVHSLNTNALSRMHLSSTALWIASAKGINVLDTLTNKFIEIPKSLTSAILDKSIEDILIDRKNRVWLTTFNDGVYLFDQLANKVHHFTISNLASGLTTNKTTQLLEDHNGNIWLGSFDGVHHFNSDLHKFNHLSKTTGMTVSSLMQDSNDKIWIGTWESGAIKLESLNNRIQLTTLSPQPNSPNTLPHLQVFDIFEDNQKNLWLASSDTLSKISMQARNFYHLSNFKKEPCYIKGLKQSKDSSIWFSCTKDLYRLKPKENQAISPLLTTSTEINDIKEDHEGNLWLLFYRKDYLLRYNPKDQSSTYFYANKNNGLSGGVILDMLIDSEGKIWAGTYAGHLPQNTGNLFLFDDSNQRFNKVVENVNVLTITELASSKLLLTMPQGVFIYDNQLNSLDLADPSFDLSTISRVNTAYKDRQGNVWLSIFESGIFIYNSENQKIAKFHFPSNKATKDIASIIEDNRNNMWFSSGQELIKYDKNKKAFINLEKKNGIQINKFMLDASLLSISGNLLFAGINSIVMFEPSKVFEKTPAPTINLTEFRLSNNPVAISSEKNKSVLSQNIADLQNLPLTYKDYLFSFTFSLLNFNSSPSDQYAYKLEGIDRNWIYTDSKNRIATYTTIPAGEYTFRFKGQDQGIWHEGAPLKLTVTPPLWLTWQAYLLYVILFTLVIYFLIVSKTKTLKNQAIKLEQGIQDKTKELQEKSNVIEELLSHKKQLFVNISHEFRTPLSLIIAPIEAMLSSEGCNKKQENYALIKRNAQRLLRMVEQLLELSKLDSPLKVKFSNYSLKQTIEAIIFSFQSAFDERNIIITVNKFEDKKLKLVRDSLEKIIINLLSNSLKYTQRNGQVHIEVCYDENNVHVTINDNGIGISHENHKHVFERFTRFSVDYNEYTPGSGIGLSLVKELVEANNGHITFESKLHEGTSFTVTLPILIPSSYNSADLHNESHIDSDIQLELTTLNSPTIKIGQHYNLTHLPKILIVEDNTDMRNFLLNNLNNNAHCLDASSGKIGLELAFKHLPDIIISDVMMPQLDGIELVKRLKENELTSHIPIIMLSAKSDLDSRLLGWANNVDEYMPKPFHLSELKLRIRNILAIREILQQRLAKGISKKKPKWSGSINNKKEQDFIDSFEKIIEDNYINPELKRGDIAKNMAMSERQLNRKLSALFDLGFSEYMQKFRLRKATELLGLGLQVNQICYDVGFNSSSYFIKCFKAEYGKTVKQYEEEYCRETEEINDNLS